MKRVMARSMQCLALLASLEEHPMMKVGRNVPCSCQEERSAKKVGRNDPCPCGSGKKFKACCGY